ncbi:MAG: zinc-ribbon domain-containing protein [Umezawaea sp.]
MGECDVVIFGFRTKVFVLTVLTLLCPRCGNSVAHPLHKAVTKFTLFFIPLFPVKTKYTVQCTFCGFAGALPRSRRPTCSSRRAPVRHTRCDAQAVATIRPVLPERA